jgi:2'-5' RNA ligase/ribosomal protein S18 acetylase RimI-like enzyme
VPDRRRLLVALVLTGRVAAEIDVLRRATGSRELERIPPHLTLVPPRNIPAADLETVLATVRQVAAQTAPLRLLLGPVATFPPDGRVLYLRVDDPDNRVGELAGALATGPLAPPPSRSSRPFVAHVTVTNRATPARSRAALESLDGYRVEVEVAQLSLLQMDEGVPHHPWRRLADVAFGPPALRGRGGLEVTVVESAPEDPALARFLDVVGAGDAPGRSDGSAPSFAPTRVLGAWVDGRVAGVISGRVSGSLLVIDAHLVAVAERGLGIGTKLLSAFELLAKERGATLARLVVAADSAAAAYYAGRGYAPVARVGGVGGAGDELLLARSLEGVV